MSYVIPCGGTGRRAEHVPQDAPVKHPAKPASRIGHLNVTPTAPSATAVSIGKTDHGRRRPRLGDPTTRRGSDRGAHESHPGPVETSTRFT